MSRQLLATGARLHRESLRIVAPVEEDALQGAMTRIVARDATPESVLDHGFDPALGAREAMRGRGREIERPAPKEVSGALAQLREIARLGDPDPRDAPLGGLEGEVMAEVIGAAVLRHGEAPDGRDRLALESHVEALADPASWRRILKQSPSGTVREADALAVQVAGTVPGDDSGRAPTPARILARGALTARAMGEDAVADLFEDGLGLYGRRASLARALGRPRELVADRATEDEIRAERLREAADRAGRTREAVDRAAPPKRQTARRSRGLDVTRMLDDLDMSEERLAEEAFGIFLPRRRRARPGRVPHKPRLERCREELRLRGDWHGRADALKAARDEMALATARRAAETERAAREATPDRETGEATRLAVPAQERSRDDPELALRLAMAVTARTPMAAPVHAQDLQEGIATLLERTGAGGSERDAVAGLAKAEVRNDAERELVRAVRQAAEAGPLPDAGSPPLRPVGHARGTRLGRNRA